MKYINFLTFIITLLFCFSTMAKENSTAPLSSIVPALLEDSQQSIEKLDLYPKYLVYGFEVDQSIGIADIFEVGGSLGVEFHYERRD
jgi:hypothetical protein